MAVSPETMELVEVISGIVGSVIALGIFLSPIASFWRIIQEKHTVGFRILPYVVTLFSATLYIYYGILKQSSTILVINVVGTVIELLYLGVYLFYSSPQTRIKTGMKLAAFNVADNVRTILVGTTCAIFSVCVFAAPLSVMVQVMRTGNVDLIPIPMSIALTFSSVSWFFFGFATSDFFVSVPNALGLLFGIAQVVLYFKYRQPPTATAAATTATVQMMEEGRPAQAEDCTSSPDTVEIVGDPQPPAVEREEEEEEEEGKREEKKGGGGEGEEKEEKEEKKEEGGAGEGQEEEGQGKKEKEEEGKGKGKEEEGKEGEEEEVKIEKITSS